MNAHAERFNRTLQEEYIDYHDDALLDPEQFTLLKADRGPMRHYTTPQKLDRGLRWIVACRKPEEGRRDENKKDT